MTDRRGTTQTVASVTALLRDLVQLPSQGGIDNYQPIVDHLVAWLQDAGLRPVVHQAFGAPVAISCSVHNDRPGPHYVLDACLDTAPTGDLDAWTRDPFSLEITDGWMHGRGTADSKAAVAVFAHLLRELAQEPDFPGRLSVLFDLDEHTEGFAGIRAYLVSAPPIDGVMIGYPGTSKIVTGGRGFLRARFTVHGISAHTGSMKDAGTNAITRATHLVELLQNGLPLVELGDFGLPPKLTITSISAGTPGSYSVVPDRCEVEVDVRLTPAFTAGQAQGWLHSFAAELDLASPTTRATSFEREPRTWPAFHLPDDHVLPAALLAGARAAGLDPRLAVAGPSNIGCLLADRGIPATAGFGVDYVNLHAAGEAVRLDSIAPVYDAYRTAVGTLLAAGPH